jgi:hypothetical protein
MNTKEIKAKVNALLSSGMAKAEVFAQLSGQGIKDHQLAYFIASYPDPARCEQHNGKVNALITIMFIQAVIGFLGGYGMGAEIGTNAKWIVGFLAGGIPLLFAWGFYTNRAVAYNLYILLSIIQLPRGVLEGFKSGLVGVAISIAMINIGLIAYVWYVRAKIFPDFVFIGPKKIKGEYVFSD